MKSFSDHNSFVFISYAHKDADVVLPIISGLQRAGISVWYDDGIEAGTEWPEFIAEKLISCTKMIVMLTNNYVASHNCTRELNLAVEENKPILTIHLQKSIQLSPGYRMQLGTTQGIFRHRFSSQKDFMDNLASARFFEDCRVEVNIHSSDTVGGEPATLPDDKPLADDKPLEGETGSRNPDGSEGGANAAPVPKKKKKEIDLMEVLDDRDIMALMGMGEGSDPAATVPEEAPATEDSEEKREKLMDDDIVDAVLEEFNRMMKETDK